MESPFENVTQGTLTRAEVRLLPEPVAYWTKQIQKAASFVVPGKMPCDYAPWAEWLAQEAILTNDDVDIHQLSKMVEMAEERSINFHALISFSDKSPLKWGVCWPKMDQLVPAGSLVNTVQERVRRNAYRMLDAVHRRRGG